jgi:hypothetical protein
MAALPATPSENDIAFELDKWLGLFWRLKSPPQTDVVGLIGELTVLRVAACSEAWLRGWHGDPNSTIDFILTEPHVEVEVKTTRSAARRHVISGDQAFGAGNRFFASVQVDLRESGRSIGDFAREIADGLAPEDVQRLWNLISAECGSAYSEMMSERFIWQVSIDSLCFFRRDDVPRPQLTYPFPPGVSGLRFTSDFTNSPSIPADAFFAYCGTHEVLPAS